LDGLALLPTLIVSHGVLEPAAERWKDCSTDDNGLEGLDGDADGVERAERLLPVEVSRALAVVGPVEGDLWDDLDRT
jgi:hypothetical protein